MDILIIVLTTADILIALMLTALVLVQQSKEGGFGSAFGGMGESVFGAHAQGHLSKLTVVFASLFLLITLTLTVITGQSKGPRSAVEDAVAEDKPAQIEAPADVTTPAAPAATELPPVDVPGTVTVVPPATPATPTVPETPAETAPAPVPAQNP
jgi:preprotein translocase subunit SecG